MAKKLVTKCTFELMFGYVPPKRELNRIDYYKDKKLKKKKKQYDKQRRANMVSLY
tara:strand:- start:1428 stop:1592 length:165 start_codon:yes stop_codon:yes gene_type:complete